MKYSISSIMSSDYRMS